MTDVFSDETASSTHIPVEEMTDRTCPKCGSTKIMSVDRCFTGDGLACQPFACMACKAEWQNLYDFSAVYLIDEDDENDEGIVIDIPRHVSNDEESDSTGTSVEVLRAANEDLRHELEVVYGKNADLERRIQELQRS